jgi:hypothetical protein
LFQQGAYKPDKDYQLDAVRWMARSLKLIW